MTGAMTFLFPSAWLFLADMLLLTFFILLNSLFPKVMR
jgi:hypothetical protein